MKTLSRDKTIYRFAPAMEPALSVRPGERVCVEPWDCFREQITDEKTLCSEIDFGQINPATGPIHVEGAERGDTLKVTVIDVVPADRGVAVTVPGEGLLGDQVKEPSTKIIPIMDGFCRFAGQDLPVKAMIGVIGVAPDEGIYPTGTPWRHGGNMDTSSIGPGAVLYLPVSQAGALLALGDCHAAMGDGEICCSGCEVSATVTLEIDVVKGASWGWPLVERDGELAVVVSGDDVGSALKEAADEAVKALAKARGLSWEESYVLASLAMDLRVSQLVDPKKTVRAVMPQSLVTARELLIEGKG